MDNEMSDKPMGAAPFNPFHPEPPSELEIRIDARGAICTVTLKGMLCHRDVAKLREEVMRLIHERHKYFIVDCTRLQRIDSVGIGILINLTDQAAYSGGCLLLVKPAVDALYNLIRNLTGGNRSLLPLYDSIHEANAAVHEYAGDRMSTIAEHKTPGPLKACLEMLVRKIDAKNERTMGEAVLVAMWHYWSQHPDLDDEEIMDVPEFIAMQLSESRD